MRAAPFWATKQQVVVIPYRRFGTTYRTQNFSVATTHCVITQRSILIIYFAAEA